MLPEEQRGWFINVLKLREGRVFIGASYGRRYLSKMGLASYDDLFSRHSLILCVEPLTDTDFAKFKRVAPGILVEWSD